MKQRETLVIENDRFDLETRAINLPLTSIRGVVVAEVHINGIQLPTSDFSFADTHLKIANGVDFSVADTMKVIIQFDATNILIKFWLPVLIALLGTIGTIAQPVLHTFGLLYQSESSDTKEQPSWKFNGYGYHADKHKFQWILSSKDKLTDQQKKDWVVFVGLRLDDKSSDAKNSSYEFVEGPIELKDHMDIIISANPEFTNKWSTTGETAMGGVYIVKRGITVSFPFLPVAYQNDLIRLVGESGESKQ